MAAITNADIQAVQTEVRISDRLQEARGAVKASTARTDQPRITIYDPSFQELVGPSPTHSLLLSTQESTKHPHFHEACVYIPAHEELYITSNMIPHASASTPPSGQSEDQPTPGTIYISRCKLHRTPNPTPIVEWAKMRPPPGLEFPNGGANYHNNSVLFCVQGTPSRGTGGIYHLPRTGSPIPLITNFHGRDFNSVNDVIVTKDGAIWFTDPTYGHEQGFRQPPQLPCQVYRFCPKTGHCRVVADGFGRPNGICFSPDETICYITDTDHVHGDGRDLTRASHIYAFDVQTISGAPFLVNKRVFAFAADGFPDGIACDVHGNVYSGCGDGVEVWSPAGDHIGVIEIPGGVANFCFGRGGELFICAEHSLWRVQLAETTKGALLGI